MEPLISNENYSVTIMTSLSNHNAPFALHLREESNNQWDFLEFITFLVDKGHLVEGDVLVIDNCAVHAGEDSSNALFSLLEVAGVKLVFLPTYSPELNPCELVFAEVKNYLRFNRGGDKFDREVMFAFSLVTILDIFSMYFECVWMDFCDPPTL